jgi:hypothetical protein
MAVQILCVIDIIKIMESEKDYSEGKTLEEIFPLNER